MKSHGKTEDTGDYLTFPSGISLLNLPHDAIGHRRKNGERGPNGLLSFCIKRPTSVVGKDKERRE